MIVWMVLKYIFNFFKYRSGIIIRKVRKLAYLVQADFVFG